MDLLFLIFNCSEWTTTPFYRDLDVPKTKTLVKLFNISQNESIIINFLIFFGWAMDHPSPRMALPLLVENYKKNHQRNTI